MDINPTISDIPGDVAGFHCEIPLETFHTDITWDNLMKVTVLCTPSLEWGSCAFGCRHSVGRALNFNSDESVEDRTSKSRHRLPRLDVSVFFCRFDVLVLSRTTGDSGIVK